METSTTQTAPSATVNGFGRPLIRSRLLGTQAETQQTLDERLTLDMDTRVRYLEEDVLDNRNYINHNLDVVRDQSKETVRKEGEDIRELHSELAENVQILRNEMNYNLTNVENDISAVDSKVDFLKDEVDDNTWRYYRLNNGLYLTINFIKEVEFLLKDEIYELEQKVEQMRTRLVELERLHEMEPSVGPVGYTGGVQSSDHVMGKAELALQDWMNEAQSSSYAPSDSKEIANVESENKETLEELLHELIKYNM